MKKNLRLFSSIFAVALLLASCKKTGETPAPTPTNPCASKTILVTGNTTPASNATTSNGVITATASGSTGFTYSINGTTFQATSTFSGLAVGNYTVTAKDGDNCTGTQAFSINVAACPTITAGVTPTTTVKCATANTGSLTLVGGGGAAPYTYAINGGAFQAAGLFSGLAQGSVTYIVKDANGCTASGSSTIAFGAAGTGFTAVKAIMGANCTGCHGGSTPQSGINFTDDCTIVAQKARIKARAVDASPSQMPPSGGGLSATDKAVITAWVAAGGNFNN